MKRISLLMGIIISMNCVAQVTKPLAFPDLSGSTSPVNNWYKDYVGVAFAITTPSSIAGPKTYTIANDGGGGANEWGGAVTSPILNVQLAKPSDSEACSTITPGSLAGKIAFIFRGNCEFGAKSLAAEQAGAIAVIIVNNIPGGPVAMGAGAVGASVTIPVIMISQADGLAINNQLNSSQTVTASFTTWGYNNTNDLAILPSGYTQWHAMVTPLSQVGTGNGNPAAYKGFDGAFIGNFGTADQTNVKLKSSLSWTPTGGTAQSVRTDSLTFASFPQSDSILAVGIGNSYDLHPTTTGTYTVNYSLSMDNADDFPGDNMITHSYQISDSIFSKGRYTFPDAGPVATIYYRANAAGGAGPNIGGNMFYVANGTGFKAKSGQYKIASNASELSAESTLLLLFKWKDTVVVDSMVEVGELVLVGINQRTYNTLDSTGDHFDVEFTSAVGNPTDPVLLESNTWYYVAVEASTTAFIGYDGMTNFYPRTYLRHHAPAASQFTEFYTLNNALDLGTLQSEQQNAPNGLLAQFAFEGRGLATREVIDSARYAQQKMGFVASVALKIAPYVAGVGNTKKDGAALSLYPNPASQTLTVDVTGKQPSSKYLYSVVDLTGKVVYSTINNKVNGLTDKHTINTGNMANGTYLLLVTGDDNNTTIEKFVVSH